MGKDSVCQYGRSVAKEHLQAMLEEVDGVREGRDIEHIHRMRVASRRLRSALRIFKVCFRGKKCKEWRNAARDITKSLGEARDLDVQIAFLEEMGEGRPDYEGFGHLVGHLRARRDALQPIIVRLMDRLENDDPLIGLMEELREHVCKVKDCRSLHHHAFEQSSMAVEELFAHAWSVPVYEDFEGHHALRIASKRLRYALEAFRDVYDDELREEIHTLKGLQDTVGELHDCDVWLQRIPSLRGEVPEAGGAFDILASEIEGRRRVLHRKLMELWYELQQDRFFDRTLNKLEGDAPIVTSETAIDRTEEIAIWAEDLHGDRSHADQVRDLSLLLFDITKGLHRMTDEERRLLEIAALVHDVGLCKGADGHQRNALDIIEKAELPLERSEKRIIACVARYHGTRAPRDNDIVFRDLRKGERTKVRKMAALLSLADALDIQHVRHVSGLTMRTGREEIVISISGAGSLSAEIERANFKKGQFERVFKRRVLFEQ